MKLPRPRLRVYESLLRYEEELEAVIAAELAEAEPCLQERSYSE